MAIIKYDALSPNCFSASIMPEGMTMSISAVKVNTIICSVQYNESMITVTLRNPTADYILLHGLHVIHRGDRSAISLLLLCCSDWGVAYLPPCWFTNAGLTNFKLEKKKSCIESAVNYMHTMP